MVWLGMSLILTGMGFGSCECSALPGMLNLYQAAGAPKQYWIVPNAGHAQAFTVDPEGYIQRVDTFFDTYLH